MDNLKDTEKAYGLLWQSSKTASLPNSWHFNVVQEIVDVPIVRGERGVDIGSGCGYDTYIMARNNPSVKIVSMDLSDGVYRTKELTSRLGNVQTIKCSVLDTPMKDNVFDFAYSFGVLHHTANPQKGLLEIARILKKNSPVFLYFYEDHSENFAKFCAVKLITKLRAITVRIYPRIIYVLSWVFSPLVFILFSLPSKILKKFRPTQNLANKIPFNFGTNLFSLRGDLYDRFSAPIEHRFKRHELYNLLNECGFRNITVTRLKDRSGWLAWGYKNDA